jgi:hypothetical protein
MNRFLLRAVIGAVLLVVATGAAFLKRSSAGEEYRKVAHKIVAQIDGYSAKPDYYDWLADWAHDKVFNESYHMAVPSRYSRDHSYVDDDKYISLLLETMIEEARTDNAVQVAEAVEKFRKSIEEPEPPQPGGGRR